jgi:hypothetical protein
MDQCFPRPDRESVALVRQDRGAIAVASSSHFVVRLLKLFREWGVNVTNHKGYSPSFDGTSIMMLCAKT